MVKEDSRGGGTAEEEQTVQGGEALSEEHISEIQVVVREKMEGITEGTSSDTEGDIVEECDCEEHVVTEVELALIAAELIEQGKVEARFVREQAKAEKDGEEVAGYTESIGLLRSGTRKIAQLILAGLVLLSASDWAAVKAHADPVALSANAKSAGSGTEGAAKVQLTEEQLIYLESAEGRNISLEEFKTLSNCKSKDAADLWAQHEKAVRYYKEHGNAKPGQSPITLVWPKPKKAPATGNDTNFFSFTTSTKDERGNIIPITKYYLVSTIPDASTRQFHNLLWTGYLGTDEKKANKTAELLLQKM